MKEKDQEEKALGETEPRSKGKEKEKGTGVKANPREEKMAVLKDIATNVVNGVIDGRTVGEYGKSGKMKTLMKETSHQRETRIDG